MATDLGRPTTPIRAALQGCNFLVLEANHDERRLRAAAYPWSVKQRIGGSRGHLSNRHAAQFARELAHPGLGGILLAHLSAECNDPNLALDCVSGELDGSAFCGVLEAAAQDVPGRRYDVPALVAQRAARPDGRQLSLFANARPDGESGHHGPAAWEHRAGSTGATRRAAGKPAT